MAAHVLKYSKHAVYHPILARKVYENYIKLMNIPREAPYSVMDVGCGDGRVLFDVLHPLLPSNYSEIVASDIDQSMIDYCKTINKNPNVSFSRMDIETNELPPVWKNRFNVIFSCYCLMYVRDLRQASINIRKMLKPQGEILMLFISKKNPLYTTYAELGKIDRWKPYMKAYEGFVPHFSSGDPKSELNSLFKHVDLKVLSMEFLHNLTYESSRRNFLEVYKSMDKISRQIPGDKQDQYENDFKKVFSEVSGINMLDEAILDQTSQLHIPNVVIHAKKNS